MKKLAIAVKETIFQVAVAHLVILAYHSLSTGDWMYLHMGSILDLQFLIPSAEYTVTLGVILALATLLLIAFNYTRAKKN